MIKKLGLVTLLLCPRMAISLHAQNLFSGAPAFKVGDSVEVQAFSQWIPGRIAKLVLYGESGQCATLSPTCKTVGGYIVTYVVNPTSGPQEFMTAVTDVRARATTQADKLVTDETTAALARQPRGNSVGAKYGTRDPRTCGDRTAPARGAPSVAQATQYVICELEQGDGSHPLNLVTNVKVQVASVSHPPNQLVREITAATIDPSQPIWDIRGGFTIYRCFALATLTATNDFARTHNCWQIDQTTATGYCYKDTFGDWHCGLLGTKTEWQANVLPPAGY
jgi:hypothetical protein